MKTAIASLVRLVIACGVSMVAGAIGSLAVTDPAFSSCYAAIQKPGFTPPSWVFGPVWTVLNASIWYLNRSGMRLYFVASLRPACPERSRRNPG